MPGGNGNSSEEDLKNKEKEEKEKENSFRIKTDNLSVNENPPDENPSDNVLADQSDGTPVVNKTDGTPTTQKATQGSGSYYDELYNNLKSELATLDRNRKRDERIEAAVAAMNSIGDIGRAFHNMYATTKYAPSSFDPNNTMSAKYAERAQKARAEYAKNRAAIMNYMQNVQKAKQADSMASEKFDLLKQKYEDDKQRKQELAEARIAADKALADYRKSREGVNTEQQRYYKEKADIAKLTYEYMEEYGLDYKHALEEATIELKKAQTAAANARANKDSRTAGGTTVTETKTDKRGNTTSTTKTTSYGGGTSTPWTGGSSNRQGYKSTPWVK